MLARFFADVRVWVSRKRASSSDSPSSSVAVGGLGVSLSEEVVALMDESVPVRVSVGLGLVEAFRALAKDLKMSDLSRLREGCLVVVDVALVLPAELGREVSSFLIDGWRFSVGLCAAFEVGFELGSGLMVDLGSMVGGGGLRPVLRRTFLFAMTP